MVFDLVDQRRVFLPQPTPRQYASLIMYRLVVIPPTRRFFYKPVIASTSASPPLCQGGRTTQWRMVINAAKTLLTH